MNSASQTVALPKPQLNIGSPVMEALSQRHSTREYAPTKLTCQELSNLLWAANGVNRTDGRRTAPSALNKGDIDVYVLTDSAAFVYEPERHALRLVASGDHRALIRGWQEDFPIPPVALIMVTTPGRFGVADEKASATMGAVDAGIVSENISLFCAGVGLATVPRACMDTEAISKLLGLPEGTYPVINNPVGHFVEH